jgi:predicted ATPase/class 3 adenylate cyclase
MLCPKCAFANPQSASFCTRCGASLKSGDLIPELDDQPLAQAERRRLSVMFCDLVGSTALSGQLDPEELHDLTRQYQRVCADVTTRHGGYVAQYLGDGLLVFFGYPIAHEDDARRAVRAGLDILSAISGLSARLAKSLQIRVAVHTGLAVVGHLGDGSDPNAMSVVGETPNIAARLQSLAEPGTVIISAATFRLVEGFFHCRSLGASTLKGVVEPMELYSVLGESGIQSRFDQAVASGLTPFVSRETEFALLLQRWQQARDGAGQIVMLSGEAGIGKTRLIRALKERTSIEPITELAARCSPYYQDSALYPLIVLLERSLQFQRDDTAETKLATLERLLESFAFPLSDFVPLFAALLSLPHDNRYPPPPMTSQRLKQKTFEALASWLLKLAQEHPTRVVVEDVHWADPSTLELLNLLIDQVSQSRLFVVVIFRSEFVPPWRSKSNVTGITLGRLSRTATELMIERVAGQRLPVEVTNEIAQKTEGVPLFVEELTRMVLESGMLRKQDDHYELISPLVPLAIPSTLYESLMARLDRLGRAKEVAQLAATIGREFSYDLLQAISPLDEARLTGALNRLVEAELIDQYLLPPQTNYAFKHAMIRDAAYGSLLRTKRREYHGRIAEVLQKRFSGTADAHPELLATHYTEAGLIEQAIPFWLRGGQRALERSANQESISHLNRGLELLRSLSESPERLQQELLLQSSLGTALLAAKGLPSLEVGRVYARARELCQQVGETPQFFRILYGLWVNYASRAEHATALELGKQCLQLAESAQDDALLLEAHHALGVGFCAAGEFSQGLEHLERVISLYNPRRHGSHAHTYGHDPAAVCLIHAGWALWFLGYPQQALQKADEGLALARKLTHPSTSATATAFAAWLYQFCRNGPVVEQLATTAITISAEHDFAFYGPIGTLLRGWALTERGQLDQGIGQMRLGLEAFRATDAVLMIPYFSTLLAQACAKAGQVEEGLDVLAAVDSSRERFWEAELHRVKGELILAQRGSESLQPPHEQEAEASFHRALALARKLGSKALELRAATSLARLWYRQGKTAEARQVLLPIYNWFTEGLSLPDLKDAKDLIEKFQNDHVRQ